MGNGARALLLLDVDGPLNPWYLLTAVGHKAGGAYKRHHITGLADFPDNLTS